MLHITASIAIDESELDWQAIRASGPGGQHVNKTSTAVQLMFDITKSSLPEHYKTALLQKSDHRISASGKIIIKSQQSRSQEMNKEAALQQLVELIRAAGVVQKNATPPNPPTAANNAASNKRNNAAALKACASKSRGSINLQHHFMGSTVGQEQAVL